MKTQSYHRLPPLTLHLVSYLPIHRLLHQENMTCLFLSFFAFLSLFAYYELKSELRKNTDM